MEKTIAREARCLGGMQAWLIWILTVSFAIWVHIIQTGYAIFNPELQVSLNLTLEQVGMAAAVYPCTAAILQLFTGNMMDQFGPRKTILPAVICVSIGVVIFSFAKSYSMILLSQVILGCGTCFGFAGAGYITSIWFHPKRFGLIFGLVQVLLSFSVAFGQLGFDWLLRSMSWREILLAFSAFGVGLSVLAVLILQAPEPIPKVEFHAKEYFVEIIRRSLCVIKKKQVIASAVYGGIVYGFIWALGVVWLPKIITAHGLTLRVSNYSVSSLWMGVAVGSLIVDRCCTHLHSIRKTLLIFLGFQCISLVAILYFDLTAFTAIFYSFLFGFGTASHMLTYTIGKNAVPLQYSGSAISIVNAAMFFIGGVFAAIIGSYLDGSDLLLQDYQRAAVIFWIGMAIAFVSIMFFDEQRKEQVEG